MGDARIGVAPTARSTATAHASVREIKKLKFEKKQKKRKNVMTCNTRTYKGELMLVKSGQSAKNTAGDRQNEAVRTEGKQN